MGIQKVNEYFGSSNLFKRHSNTSPGTPFTQASTHTHTHMHTRVYTHTHTHALRNDKT